MVITPSCEPRIEGCFFRWMQNNMCDTQWSEFNKLELEYIFYNWTCGSKSEEPSVGSSTRVANDRYSFTSSESDCTLNPEMVITPSCKPRIEGCFFRWMQNNMCDTQWSKFSKLELVYIFYNSICGPQSEEPSVVSGTHVANDRSSFTSSESDYTSNVTHVAGKQRVDRHRIIHAEQSSSFEPILRQNFCDGG
jgi:hypothetical protein